MRSPDRLRVALIAGTLAQAGAEKQLVYIARTLVAAGVETRVYSLTRGEFYEGVLEGYGLRPHWVGPFTSPAVRLAVLTRQMRDFRPHIIQSIHTFTNLYAGIIGRMLGAVSVGFLQSTVAHTRVANGLWTRWLLGVPDGLLVNSRMALQEVLEMRLARSGSVYLVRNVIELPPASVPESPLGEREAGNGGRRRAIFVGRLIPAKRLDRFLRALALACQQEPTLEGLVVGEGRCRVQMEQLAAELGLGPAQVRFLGRRDDVPDLLRRADMLVLSSDREGLPNVVLEAMAAGLPVITTPAGDAAMVVEDGVTGHVVPFDDVEAMASHMIQLAGSPELRERLGKAGLQKVTQQYSLESLSDQLMAAYRGIAARKGHRGLLRALEGVAGAAFRQAEGSS